MVEGAVSMLSHYMKDDKKRILHTDDDEEGVNFLQNVTCFKCGKKGHYTTECDAIDIDDKKKRNVSTSALWYN